MLVIASNNVVTLINQKEMEDVIQASFTDYVVSDLLVDIAQTGDIIDSRQVINNIQEKIPALIKVLFVITPTTDRVRIFFNSDGTGEKIEVPPMLRKGLGEVLVLHEVAHLFYTIDILNDKIVKHKFAPQAFTILRVLEDVAIEKKLEEEFSEAVDIFKTRSAHIMPAYKQHTRSKFAHEIDQLFLYLRGYTSQEYKGDKYILRHACEYIEKDDIDTKIDAVLNIVCRLTGK